MIPLDASSAAQLGGWDTRYAVTRAFQMRDGVAAALIDTNGDGACIDLDQWHRTADGVWHEGFSGSAGEEGVAWSRELVAAWGRDEPGTLLEVDYAGSQYPMTAQDDGWWLFVAVNADPDDVRCMRPLCVVLER